jgi:hypothetical protein
MLHIQPVKEPVEGPFVWKGADMAERDDWKYELTDDETQELDAAAEYAEATGKPIEQITKDDFPLEQYAKVLDQISDDLENGRGFVLIRGVPVERYGLKRSALVYWGIGQHLGIPVSQNGLAAMLTHVRNEGGKEGQFDGALNRKRGYNSNQALGYHTDSSDVVGLLCLRPAMKGGVSTIASSAAIHNELLRTRPDLVDLLYQVYPADNYGEQEPTEAPYHYTAPFSYYDGKLSVRWVIAVDKLVEKYPEIGEVPPGLVEAREIADKLADEWRLDMGFRPGDIQFLNNYAILHSRTEFEDYPEPERRRHLLRLWLTLHNGRKLATNFGRGAGRRDRWGGRGGIRNQRGPIQL